MPNIETVMQSAAGMRQQLTQKAVEDPEFRAQLVADPKAVIGREFDIDVPDDVEIRVLCPVRTGGNEARRLPGGRGRQPAVPRSAVPQLRSR